MINTILVVDDNALDNANLRNSLYHEHYNIITALNGQEAMKLIENRNVDLILLDMVMPVMDGLAFLEEFKKNKHYGAIPVIMTTSIDKPDIIAKVTSEYELFDYMIKPICGANRTALINKVRAALEHRHALKERLSPDN